MKPNQLATLVLRLMGIYCLVLLIPMSELFNNVLFYAQSGSGSVGTAMVVITLVLLIGWLSVGISLMVFSKVLGEMLCPTKPDEGGITAVSFEQI